MKNYKYILSTLLPLHIIFFILIPYIDLSALTLFYFLLGYIFIGGLGVEIGLHRWASHRAVEVNKVAKPIIIYASLLSCQGHPIWWAAVHRGLHHKHSDTVKDSHSPVSGKWHAFIGWILTHNTKSINYKFSVDLLRDKLMTFTSKYYEIIIILTWIILGSISLNFLFWFAIVPTLIAFYSVNTINLLCHLNLGYRNYSTNDNSKNIALLGYFCWGNGWHNNHHHQASSYDFGKGVSNNWWEFDPCTLLLPFIKSRSKK